jgi:DnaJ domain
MTDDLNACYELLGVKPGVSREELKAAYRDLAKVWHPDRFAHEPRLQAKAQEKLKEINDAYDFLLSSKGRKRQPSSPNHSSAHYRTYTVSQTQRAPKPRTRWSLGLIALLLFAATFLFTTRSLVRRNAQGEIDPVALESQATTDANEKDSRTVAAGESSRAKSRSSEESVDGITIQSASTPVEPMATETVTIDPTTGLLARSECPVKNRMTYPRGSEPRQYCTVHLPRPPEPEVVRPKDSRVKSIAKRITSPSKWFEGKEK